MQELMKRYLFNLILENYTKKLSHFGVSLDHITLRTVVCCNTQWMASESGTEVYQMTPTFSSTIVHAFKTTAVRSCHFTRVS